MTTQTFDNQVIYKLAAIETRLENIAGNLGAAVQRLEDRIAESHRQQAGEHARLETRVEGNEKRLVALEKYKDNLTAKTAGVVSVVTLFWALFGKSIEQTVGGFF